MSKLFLSVANLAEPVVGSRHLHETSFLRAVEELTESFERNEITHLLVDHYSPLTPIGVELSSDLESFFRVPGAQHLIGVFFHDCLSFDVLRFINLWRENFGWAPLPKFFGLLHTTNKGGYAHNSVVEFERGYADSVLQQFAGVFAHSRTALAALARSDNQHSFAPYFAASTVEEKPFAALNNTARNILRLNWIYSYSHVDNYNQFILLVNKLNAAVQKMHALAKDPQSPKPVPLNTPREIHAHLFTGNKLPEGLAKPAEWDKIGRMETGEVLDGTFANVTPRMDSVTVSFNPRAESDNRLLKLAEYGCLVLAPNAGIYREALDPVCLYDPNLLANFQQGYADLGTENVALMLYDRIQALIEISFDKVPRNFLRRQIRQRILHGAADLADQVLLELGYAR